MKVSVNAQINYHYEVEVPENVDLESYCDTADPVYFALCKIMATHGLRWDGSIVSIINDETGKILYEGE